VTQSKLERGGIGILKGGPLESECFDCFERLSCVGSIRGSGVVEEGVRFQAY
jgi:hypothetical protein